MKMLAPRAAAYCALLATISHEAMAQETASSWVEKTPAEMFAMSPGGVDVRTGRFAYNETDLSIGSQKEGGALALSRIMSAPVYGHMNPFGNLSHNWDIMITEARVDISQGSTVAGLDFRMGVHFGGRSETFESRQNSSGFAQLSRGARATLTYSGDRTSSSVVYTFTAADGTVATFRPLGNTDCSNARCAYVSDITEPDGTRLSFEYAAVPNVTTNKARLRRVTSSRGYALLLEGSGHVVTKACVLNLSQTLLPSDGLCPSGTPDVTYSYTNFQGKRLASVTNADGATSGFTYSTPPNEPGIVLMGFVRPGDADPWLRNRLSTVTGEEGVPQEVVSSQVFADGQTYSYQYRYTPPVEAQDSTIAGGSYTDALGRRTTLRYEFPVKPGTGPGEICYVMPCSPVTRDSIVYQQTPGPVKVIDPLNRETISDYCEPQAMADNFGCIITVLLSYTDPEGIKTELRYDGYRNITRVRRIAKPGSIQPDGSPVPDIVIEAGYACVNAKSCSKPSWTKDANGNVTDYTYSPDHGGVLTETGPAVNGVRPQKRYSYEQRYAWIKNSAGGYSQVATPTWLLTQESFCRTGAATATGCAIAGDEVRTTYDYGPNSGPNNLLLRGTVVDAGGLNLRTCYRYDAQGNKISETQPKAALTSCQ